MSVDVTGESRKLGVEALGVRRISSVSQFVGDATLLQEFFALDMFGDGLRGVGWKPFGRLPLEEIYEYGDSGMVDDSPSLLPYLAIGF